MSCCRWQAYHSQFNEDKEGNFKTLGNMFLLPIKTKVRGPAPQAEAGKPDIIDEVSRATLPLLDLTLSLVPFIFFLFVFSFLSLIINTTHAKKGHRRLPRQRLFPQL